MQKKVLAAAIGAALIIPGTVLAKDKPEPDSVVEFYGKAYPELVFPSTAGNATPASRASGANDPTYCTICLRPEGENAVVKNRDLMGATNPKDAAKGTIRADFADSIDANAVHGSDSLENAAIEVAYFFPATDVYAR